MVGILKEIHLLLNSARILSMELLCRNKWRRFGSRQKMRRVGSGAEEYIDATLDNW
jgi:hypothetical protein